jgi:hypothetical protein
LATIATVKRGIPEVLGVDLVAQDPGGTFQDELGRSIAQIFVPITAALPVLGSIGKSTAGAGAPDQTLKNFNSTNGISIATGATVTLYTVTAAKTFFLTDISIYSNSATAFLVQVKQGATVIWEGYCKGDTGPIQVTGIETQPSAPAGSALTLVFATAAATTAAYVLAGFEQ